MGVTSGRPRSDLTDRENVVNNFKRRAATVGMAVGLVMGGSLIAAPAANAAPPTMADWQYSTKAECERVAYAKLNEAFRSGWLIDRYIPCHQRNGNYWGGSIYYA